MKVCTCRPYPAKKVGQRAALQGRTNGLKVNMPSSFFSPKLMTVRALNVWPFAAYHCWARVLHWMPEGVVVVSSSNGLGVDREEAEALSSLSLIMAAVWSLLICGENSQREGGLHFGVVNFFRAWGPLWVLKMHERLGYVYKIFCPDTAKKDL